jgi:methylated-DNA-protein-cysteine methyltransferase-like protein
MTYGQVAKTLRLAGGARTAGRAMAACPSGRGIPWHRVVGAGGQLLIREPYASLQRKLLQTEGVIVAVRQIQKFRNYAWKPAQRSRERPAKTKERSGGN